MKLITVASILFSALIAIGLAQSILTITKRHQRLAYCHMACTRAAYCSVLLPRSCEDRCVEGSREIDLGTTCQELIKTINLKGYLW